MHNYYPILWVGAIIGVISTLLIVAAFVVKDGEKETGFERNMKDSEIMQRLMDYAKPFYRQFIVVGFLMLFSIAYDIISPLIVGKIEELVVGKFALNTLFLWVAGYAAILLVSMACTYFQAVILQKTGQKIISNMREDLFVHIERLSHEQLNEIPVGKLVTRTTNDTNAISLMFTNLLVNLLKNFFVIIGILIAMLFLNYELTLMVLCFVPFIMLFSIIFRKFSRRAHRKVKDCTTDINTYLSENLSGMKITQIFNREDAKMREFTDKSNALGRAQQEQIFVFGIFRPLVYMLYISSVLCLLYLGGKGYLEGTSFLGQTLTSGMIVSFYMYISKFFNPIQNLAEQFNWLQSAFASSEKVFSIMDIEPKMQDAPDATTLSRVEGRIDVDHVSFAYQDDMAVLHDVDLHIRPGETIAVVGPSGGGKSTLCQLIPRFYDVTDGAVRIDGHDVRQVTQESLRQNVGVVQQDVFLFAASILENIRYGKPGASEEEVARAAKLAEIYDDIVALPEGFNTYVGERGTLLSGGQKQRISIARIFLKDPPVLILDEATSALDSVTEAKLQETFEKLAHGRTTIIIAHRLSTVRNADRIAVIEDGRITELGSHDQLMAKNGAYAELVRTQELIGHGKE